MKKAPLLWDLCEETYFPLKIDIGKETRRQYALAMDDFGRTLGHRPTIDDLTDSTLTFWARKLLDRVHPKPLSAWTINERTGRIKTLWKWLACKGIVKTFPTVKPLPVPDPIPRAWSKNELARLFEAAELEQGTIAGIPAGLWWRARMAFHWYTGERKGAVDRLRMEWVYLDSDPPISRIPAGARKGGKKNGMYHMPPPLVDALRAIWKPSRDLVFENDRPSMYWLWWNGILKRAGLPTGSKFKTQCLRVSHATWCEKAGGDATRSLMHSNRATTMKHYIDASFQDPLPPMFDPWQRPAG